MLFSSALVLAFLATNTAQAEEHNDVFYSRYRPGFNYYNPRVRDNYNYGRYPGYYNPWYNYNVFYWNGNYYYKNQNGDYYVYKNGKWELYYQDGFNKLKNDPHYRYENGYHYYVLDDGSYYYYENGKVKSEGNYVNGKLISAATRGDGTVGEEVTDNIKTIFSIPKVLKDNRSFEVRGEVYLPRKSFELLICVVLLS